MNRLQQGTALILMALFACVVSGSASSARAPMTVYSVATGVQFINTADDRLRGARNNPFGAAFNSLRPSLYSAGNGPFPGDVAVYSLQLYSDAALKHSAGSAVYTCYFNYARTAFCQAYYTLGGFGTVVASGPIDFNATGFTIVVTGGTKKYLGARGEVVVVAAKTNSQQVDFGLIK